MNSSHTQVCTRTLPSASFGSASGWPWLPRPGTDGEPRHLHFVPTLGPLPAPQQQRGPVPADAEVMEPLVSGAKGMNTPSVILWEHLRFRLLAFPLYPSISLNTMSVWWLGLPLPALVCSQWEYSLPSSLFIGPGKFCFSTWLKESNK